MAVRTLLNQFISHLRLGLLYAGAAVGVSYLVQSTQAGGLLGFHLIIAIIVIHLIKYPFFEFGPRYTASTGQNIVHGYQQRIVAVFFGITGGGGHYVHAVFRQSRVSSFGKRIFFLFQYSPRDISGDIPGLDASTFGSFSMAFHLVAKQK